MKHGRFEKFKKKPLTVVKCRTITFSNKSTEKNRYCVTAIVSSLNGENLGGAGDSQTLQLPFPNHSKHSPGKKVDERFLMKRVECQRIKKKNFLVDAHYETHPGKMDFSHAA